MEVYDENLKVRQAIDQFFERFGFSSDAYTAKWFAIRVGHFSVYLPNIPNRVKVARMHDIHHVLTGYPANWRGEAEIGAWEIATGCRTSLVAWFLNGGAVAVGLFLWPGAVVRAFRRGWHSRTNLYHDFDYETLMGKTLKDAKEMIGLADES